MKHLKVFLHGILPAFLLASSVGQIYAFTNFSNEIASAIGATQSSVQVAFSLGIFFLGMGAAFFGPIVEKNIKLSTFVGALLFLLGFVVLNIGGISMSSLPLVYAGYGLLLGLGTGIIYITPVKTMMMWLPNWKAVAAALPIIFFGLGSTFSTIIYNKISYLGISKTIWIFVCIYAVTMLIGGILLKKPENEEKKLQAMKSDFSYKQLLKKRFFIHSWLFMFLNISAGLCLIPLAKQMMMEPSIAYAASSVSLFVALSGIFNGGGRFVFAFLSDRLPKRISIILIILVTSFLSIVLTTIWPSLIGLALLLINACYGAGFSVIPAILSEKFGMTDISKIHGAVLSAWGFAGLCGNQMSLAVGSKFGFIGVLILLLILYGANMVNYFFMKSNASRA